MDEVSQNESLRTPRWLGWIDRRGSVVLLVLVATLARMLWLVYFCEYTLVEDEAKYWLWSTRLDWSYYTKGPGVALAIRAATELLGDAEWAIRTPAVVSSAVTAIACAAMAQDVFKDRRIAFVAALLTLLVPAFAITGVLMTIDAPYLACWAVCAWAGYRAIVRARPRYWLLVGLALGAGFVFKYTIVLLVPGLVIAAVVYARKRESDEATTQRSDEQVAEHARDPSSERGVLRYPYFVTGIVLALLGLLPVLIWNAQHGWVTVRHLLGHANLPGGDTVSAIPPPAGWAEPGFNILWPLGYLGMLLAMAGPILPLSIIGRVLRRWNPAPGQGYLVACALPVLLFYFGVSLLAETEGNWPIGGFVTLTPLAAAVVIRGVQHNVWPVRFLWGAALVMGLGAWIGYTGMPTLARHTPLGGLVPLGRVMGMQEHAEAVGARLDELRAQTGLEPFVMCEHYGRASLLWYYGPGRAKVYCSSAFVGGRKDQWDVWPDTDLSNPATHAELAGRPGLLMSGNPGRADKWDWAFGSVEDIGPLEGEPKRGQTTFVGLGYRGFGGWLPARLREPGQPIGPTP